MAFSFAGNSVTPTNYITVTGAAAIWAQEPFTVAYWHRRTSDANLEFVASNLDFSSAGWRAGITTFGADGQVVTWRGGDRLSTGGASAVADGWTHWCFTVDTSFVLRHYRNGVASGSATLTAASAGNNNLIIGCNNTSSDVAVASNDVVFGEFAIWNAALSADQILELSGGAIPPMLPVAPVLYLPGDERHGNWMGGLTLTQSGTVAYTADHPPVMRPSAQVIPFPAAGTPPAGGIIPQIMHHRRLMAS